LHKQLKNSCLDVFYFQLASFENQFLRQMPLKALKTGKNLRQIKEKVTT